LPTNTVKDWKTGRLKKVGLHRFASTAKSGGKTPDKCWQSVEKMQAGAGNLTVQYFGVVAAYFKKKCFLKIRFPPLSEVFGLC
jgi:hypothetical protein